MSVVMHLSSVRWSLRANAALLVAFTGVALPALSFLLPGHLQLHVLVFFTGAGLATLFCRSANLTEWIGLSVVSSLLLSCVWTGLLWGIGLSGRPLLWVVLLGTNGVLIAVLAARSRRICLNVGPFDLVVVIVWLAIRAMQVAVLASNGFVPGPAGEESFVARGWFARDTLYFYALVEQAMEGKGWPLWNPFFGGFEIVYPRLVHVGVAGLLSLSGQTIASAAPGLLGVTLISIVSGGLGLVKSACRRARRSTHWAMAGWLLLYALALRLDLVVYPQTQYFMIAIFLLYARALAIVGLRPWKQDGSWMFLGWMLAAVLTVAHQISGSAALLSWLITGALLGRSRRWSVRGWGIWVGSSLVLVSILWAGARDPHLRPPGSGVDWHNVSVWLGSLRGWVPAMFFALWAGFVLRRTRALVWPMAGFLAVTLWIVVWGAMQEYVHSGTVLVFNAERYLYHGFLLAFPAIAILFWDYWVRCWYRPAMRVVLVLLLALPFLQLPSLAYESRGLVRDAPLRVSADMLRAYDWIRENTDLEAVVLRGPVPGGANRERFDRTIPALTGRALYVADIHNIWGYGNIPAYEHRGRLQFVRDVYAGRYHPDALSSACRARGIDLILFDEAEISGSLVDALRSRSFETVYDQGRASIVRPVPGVREQEGGSRQFRADR